MPRDLPHKKSMEFRWNDWNVDHIAKHGVSPQQLMKKKYWGMNARELEAATQQFDEPMVIDQSRPLDAKERAQWKRVKAAKQRPKASNGHQRISVSIEKGLLERATAFAKKKRLSRSRLVAMALEKALASSKC